LPGYSSTNAFNRWERVITLLVPPEAHRGTTSHDRHPHDISSSSRQEAPRRRVIISAERHSESSVLVSWSDSTRCHYDEQRWISAKSRMAGRCALTGQHIRVGDPIYKPQWRGDRRPANFRELILASALDQYVAGQPIV